MAGSGFVKAATLTTATFVAGDIEIGAVELKDATTDTRAKVGAATALVESDNSIAVQAPVLGVTTGAAVTTDAAGTVQQYLRGLAKGMPRKLGAIATQVIDATERRLDTTTLETPGSYPMTLRIIAISASCYLYQGPVGVTLPVSPNDPLGAGEWVEVTVDSAADAYFAVKQASTSTGTVVARRIDHIGA